MCFWFTSKRVLFFLSTKAYNSSWGEDVPILGMYICFGLFPIGVRFYPWLSTAGWSCPPQLFFMGRTFPLDEELLIKGNRVITENWDHSRAMITHPTKPHLNVLCRNAVGDVGGQELDNLVPQLVIETSQAPRLPNQGCFKRNGKRSCYRRWILDASANSVHPHSAAFEALPGIVKRPKKARIGIARPIAMCRR